MAFFFFDWIFAENLRLFCTKTFFFGERLKFGRKFARRLFSFFGEHLCVVSLASNISVLGLVMVCTRKVGSWFRIFLWSWPWAQTFFNSNCHFPNCQQHTMDVSHCPLLLLNVKQERCEYWLLQLLVWPDRESKPILTFSSRQSAHWLV